MSRDWYAYPYDGTGLSRRARGRREGLAHRLQPDPGRPSVEPEIAKLVAWAAAAFRELGATVEEVDPEIGPNAA